MRYELYYWPSIQGRGEFIRLALEEGRSGLRRVARSSKRGMGVPALMRVLDSPDVKRPQFAPPFLKAARAPDRPDSEHSAVPWTEARARAAGAGCANLGAPAATHDRRSDRRSARYAPSDRRQLVLS